jgi:hypothetical protein
VSHARGEKLNEGSRLRFVDVEIFHVHRVNRREDVGRALHDALSCFGQYDGRARGQEHRFVAIAERHKRQVVSLHQHNLRKNKFCTPTRRRLGHSLDRPS